jgi:hypothetical protein
MRAFRLTAFHRIALLLAFLCLAPVLHAQKDSWQTFSYPSEGFSISLPSAPTMNSQEVPTEVGTFQLRAYLVESNSAALYVGICDYGEKALGRDPQTVLKGAKEGAVSNVKGHLIRERAITLGTAPGVEFEAENDTLHFFARIYFVGTTLYQTLTAAPINDPYPYVMRFEDSFQFIPRTR